MGLPLRILAFFSRLQAMNTSLYWLEKAIALTDFENALLIE
jgi:hypothetical protein